MRKPNPLSSLWTIFKIFTEVFAQFLSMALFVGSVVCFGSTLGVWCLVVGLFSYYFSRDLKRTMALENKAQEDDDEGPDLPLGTV